jgi:dTDP-4-dehydrorhamnose reductase
MKILVTGAKGMLGQDLCPMLEDEGWDVIETDVDTLDITNEAAVMATIAGERPNYVIHCAAYTNVDGAEEDLVTATRINVKGTENIAKACAESRSVMIYISTDYVFDGTKKGAYLPSDAPSPINNYGLTKLQGEDAVKKFCKKYFIARTSWLYGHHGKNFVETMISMAEKPELKVVDDQTGCPTWTFELASGLIELIDQDPEYGIYNICGSGETSWYGFAKEIFKQMGLKVNLLPCKTEEFPRPAMRPQHSAMDNQGICRDWKLALKDYLELRD